MKNKHILLYKLNTTFVFCFFFLFFFLTLPIPVFASTYTCSVDNKTITNLPHEFFGLFTGAYYFPEGQENRQKYLQQIKAAGFSSIRLQLNWIIINRQKDTLDWSYYDPIYIDIQNAGLKALPTFINIPTWAQETDGSEKNINSFNPEYNKYWRTFVREAVKRYSSRVGSVAKVADSWEIWNEPELSYEGTPSSMVAFLNLAYEEIKEVDPQSLVFAPPISTLGLRSIFQEKTNQDLTNFLGPIIINGKFDVINVHLYQDIGHKGAMLGSMEFVAKVKDELKKHGNSTNKNAQFAVTETNDNTGSSQCEDFNNVSDVDRAALTTNRYTCLASAGVDYVYYFMAIDKPKLSGECQARTGLFDLDYKPRIAYTSMSEMISSTTRTLKPGDLNSDGRVNYPDNNIFKNNYAKTDINVADIDKNGIVNIFDYNVLVDNFGK